MGGVKIDHRVYRYEGKAPSSSKSLYLAISIGQEYAKLPLEKNKPQVSDKDYGENFSPVQDVDIAKEGSEMDTNPSSYNNVASALKNRCHLHRHLYLSVESKILLKRH